MIVKEERVRDGGLFDFLLGVFMLTIWLLDSTSSHLILIILLQ